MKHIYKFDHDNLIFVKIREYTKPVIGMLCIAMLVLGGIIVNMKYQKKVIYSEIQLILLEQDKFSQEKLITMIEGLHFPFPDIVYAQAILESNNFQSKLFIENNNLFGMKPSFQRITSSTGEQQGYAYYPTWKESVYDYALYSATYLSKIDTEENYYNYLGQFYAEDTAYVKSLRNIIKSVKN